MMEPSIENARHRGRSMMLTLQYLVVQIYQASKVLIRAAANNQHPVVPTSMTHSTALHACVCAHDTALPPRAGTHRTGGAAFTGLHLVRAVVAGPRPGVRHRRVVRRRRPAAAGAVAAWGVRGRRPPPSCPTAATVVARRRL